MYAEIVDALEKKGLIWTKNTIITLLSRLVNKGFLKIKKIGRRNQYIANISETQYKTSQTQTLIEKIYDGDAKELVCTLIYWEEKKNKNE